MSLSVLTGSTLNSTQSTNSTCRIYFTIHFWKFIFWATSEDMLAIPVPLLLSTAINGSRTIGWIFLHVASFCAKMTNFRLSHMQAHCVCGSLLTLNAINVGLKRQKKCINHVCMLCLQCWQELLLRVFKSKLAPWQFNSIQFKFFYSTSVYHEKKESI